VQCISISLKPIDWIANTYIALIWKEFRGFSPAELMFAEYYETVIFDCLDMQNNANISLLAVRF